MAIDEHALNGLFRQLTEWCRAWRVPQLPARLHIEFGHRLRTSLGRCHVRKGIIRLNGFLLLPQNRVLLRETLCHEAAHAAVYILHGPGARAHGPEWKALMKAAGMQPRATIPARLIAGFPRPSAATRPLYEYHCAVCGLIHRARVRRSRYRCRACLRAGRSGLLTIRRAGPAHPGKEV